MEEWLRAIKMERHLAKLRWYDLPRLRQMGEAEFAELGITIPGHRKRLVQAVQHLQHLEEEGACLPQGSLKGAHPASMHVPPRAGADGRADMDCTEAEGDQGEIPAQAQAVECDPGEDGASEGLAPLGGGRLLPPPQTAAQQSVDLSGSLAARAAEVGCGAPGAGVLPVCSRPRPTAQMVRMRQDQRKKYNSTSTMFITNTIVKPEIQEMIYCVAIVLHDRMTTEEEGRDDDGIHLEQLARFPFFSEDNNPLYRDPGGIEDLRRNRPRRERTIPPETTIFETIKSVYDCARFSDECVVIALIYIERLLNTTGVKILTSTWRPIVLAAIIVAQKVFDDRCLQNYEFSVYCPMFTLREINHLENKFLELLDYNVSISASTYAAFYFHIQTLCQHSTANRTPLNMESARAIEARVRRGAAKPRACPRPFTGWLPRSTLPQVSERSKALVNERKARSDGDPFKLGNQPAVMN